jgi:hypothetical protein
VAPEVKKTEKKIPYKLVLPTIAVMAIGAFYLIRARNCLNQAQQNIALLGPSLNDAYSLITTLGNRKLSDDEKREVAEFDEQRKILKTWLTRKLARSEIKKMNAPIQKFFEKGDRLIGLKLYSRKPLEKKHEIPEEDFLLVWRGDKAHYYTSRADLGICGVK